ncbi:MAG: sulfate reduction electron transfer complex DsrMKJOP subunit DsrM [Proteobacteria bacterium]|nr:menaquinol oxidoreductase [Desulfobacteraceae bacterium]MBU3980622.1 sulfate reduction electron transfer complex DsrMKJOP subunit DsrM [Pseudomonadota bacterium]MBU4013431.1 sulfate reduction electron transfer complex DsrMKJOP subunit DsrM [Pseudomonadota bacterium]MBU4068739.1 sulfate reduction electron transfer complex DsrMKJOP subunit DsrM [Pseudomonadota bacterium]MBU4100201.1 sulfate reduction electron transfer complex DsrMKJOP subunit DsrM [Pseudomonadota bacterium]
MNEKYLYSLIAVIALFLLAYAGVEAAGLQYLFGIIIPYLAIITFVVGFAMRIMDWASSPVPFRIPTTCGQQKSLPWIKHNKIDNPFTGGAVVIRMILEILFFRSLFRNTKCKMNEGPRISYVWEKWLWLFSLAFHYAFLTTLIRHLRFFLEPVPFLLQILEKVDGFLQIGLPGVLISGVVLLAAVIFLLLRRILIPQIRYFSLAADFFPLFLIIGIAVSGIMMRYFTKVNIVGVKELTMGLVTFHPHIPEGIGAIFYVHVFFVSVLLAYFPFSKLMHMGGVFLSPTRNLPTNTRAYRHINPWNPEVKIHTYQAYEDDFREKMIEAGLPVEKEL